MGSPIVTVINFSIGRFNIRR